MWVTLVCFTRANNGARCRPETVSLANEFYAMKSNSKVEDDRRRRGDSRCPCFRSVLRDRSCKYESCAEIKFARVENNGGDLYRRA